MAKKNIQRRRGPGTAVSLSHKSQLQERVASKIIWIRDKKVLLDKDLAELYGVENRNLNQAVTRNEDRFPPDFAFRLTKEEFSDLKSQIVTSSWGGTRKPPRAFTEEGVAMLSGVLNSKRAISVNIEIMRTFVRFRQWLQSNEELSRRMAGLERLHNVNFRTVMEAIRQLQAAELKPRNRLGFEVKSD